MRCTPLPFYLLRTKRTRTERRRKLTSFYTTGGCGQSFTTLIVSPEFAGKNSLRRHRLVNAALKDEIARIHAWSAKCQTPDEWQRDKAAAGTGGSTEGPPMDGMVDGKVDGVKQ